MCGIFGYIGQKTTAPALVLKGIKSLEYRGYDSWGIAALSKENLVVKKRIGEIGTNTASEIKASSLAIGHTRWATHGGVTQINAHPHLDCQKKIALIHNGIVENYADLKKTLLKKGHHFVSETDSEVICHLIEELAKSNNLTTAVRLAFKHIVGLNAFVVISTSSREIIAVRNGSPLVIGRSTKENFIASDTTALLPYTKRVYFLKDNEIATITDSSLTVRAVSSGKLLRLSTTTLTGEAKFTTKGTFPHFMLKEIHEQPKILEEISTTSEANAKKLAKLIKSAFGSYLVGCGSAAYASFAGSYLFSSLANHHVNPAIGSEFSYQEDFITKNSLVIALSQSGETMDTIEALKIAKNKGATIAALVNNLGSTIYREANFKTLLGAGPEIGVASTKAFTAKIAHLILTATAVSNNSNYGKLLVRKAAKSTATVLTPRNIARIKSLATKLSTSKHIYIIGRGLSYPASLETALKIKEVSYIHAEGFAAGELKHGVIALIEKGSPCIAFLPNDETYGANLAGAMEMKARGAMLIGISHKPHEIFDFYLPVTDAGAATIIPNVVTGQLLAYFLALARKINPDRPRNLAKSVTVK